MPFQKGNKLRTGKKSGYNEKAVELRIDLINKAVNSKSDINQALIDKAKTGDVPAIKEVFDRTLGKATEYIDVTSNGEALPTPILNVLFNHNSHPKDIKPL